MLGGLVVGRPEIVALGLPFLAAAALAVIFRPTPDLSCTTDLVRDRLVEGEEARLQLRFRSRAGVPHLEFFLPLPAPLDARDALNPVVLSVDRDAERVLEFDIACGRWGSYWLGPMFCRIRDRLGFFSWECRFSANKPLRVYPTRDRLHALIRPLDTQVFVGNRVSRAKGLGIEFADTRLFQPGDRIRSINWRATARSGELIVNEHHPERNADIVLLIDTFAEVRQGALATMDDAVRAAATAAAGYLTHRDRVGIITFGGFISWLRPGFGPMQLFRISEALIETQVVLTQVAHDVDLLPARTLPPRALVVAFTPLADPRATRALIDLRGRGFDLVVVEISPTALLPQPRSKEERLAHRLWQLSRDSLRESLRRSGITVVEWSSETALSLPFEEVTRSRRHARPVRA